MSMRMLDLLPPEILLCVFCCLDIPDILRMRRVSLYLNEVSHWRDVWSNAYRNADFLHPPGPFPSQSAHDLESTIIRSFRVDWYLRHSGTAPSGRPTPRPKQREIRYTGNLLRVCFVFGRFLLAAFCDRVRCYDLNVDGDTDGSMIYRPTHGALEYFDCVSAIDVSGRPFTCIVLKEGSAKTKQRRISIYSLSVGKQSRLTLDLLHQFERETFDIWSVDLGPRVIVVQAAVTPPPNEDWHVFAFDIHARTEYLLPSLLGEVMFPKKTGDLDAPFTVISTSTHLLLVRGLRIQAVSVDELATMFNAFALPDLSPHIRSTPVKHSHRGTIPGVRRNVGLLHDSILDPSTNETLITVRVQGGPRLRPYLDTEYGNLRLGQSHGNDAVGTIRLERLGSFCQDYPVPFLRPSFNGIGRVFHEGVAIDALEYDVRGHNGVDGAPGGAKVVEYPSVLSYSFPYQVRDYDPCSGWVCFLPMMGKNRVIQIWDLAV